MTSSEEAGRDSIDKLDEVSAETNLDWPEDEEGVRRDPSLHHASGLMPASDPRILVETDYEPTTDAFGRERGEHGE